MKLFYRIIFSLFVVFGTASLQAQVKKKPATAPVKKPYKKPAAKSITKKPVVRVKEKSEGTRVKITTDLGEIVIRLYDKTPLHRDNFVKLVNQQFYDSLLFHRVIPEFMIQGGDPDSKHAQPGVMLGRGDVGYTIPAEFDTTLYHKRGALAAARNNNPEKASSGCQFYIVQGRKYTDEELSGIEGRNGVKFSSAKRMTYKMVGGTPQLDMLYTVYGEVESGMETVDRIVSAPRNDANRPTSDIHMRMELLPEIKDTISK